MFNFVPHIRSNCSIALFMALILSSNANAAESIQDPMQPPEFALTQFRLAKLKQQRGGAAAVKKPVVKQPAREPLQLSSILIGKTRRIAIINGRTLVVGDRIEDARVINISKDRVKLLRKGKSVNLKLENNLISIRKNPVKSNL